MTSHVKLVHLYRLDFPGAPSPRYAITNSLFTLATQRPDLYCLHHQNLPSDIELSAQPSALIIRLYGDFATTLGELLSTPRIMLLLEAGFPLILDNSTEAGIFSPKGWQEFRRFLEGFAFRRLNLLILQQHALSEAECQACFHGHPSLRVRALVFHHWLHRSVHAFRSISWPPFTLAKSAHHPRKRYLCLNGWLRSHRAVVVGRLQAEGLLDEGLVTLPKLRKEIPSQTTSGRNPPDQNHFLTNCLNDYPGWAEEISAYRLIMAEGLKIDGDPMEPGGAAGSLLPHIHNRTLLSLVVETEMSTGELLRFTEKSLRPLANFHPLLIAGNPGTLKLLRAHGFKTFGNWIDESYDSEPVASLRLKYVMNEMERLIRMSSEDFKIVLGEMQSVLIHNHEHFRHGLEDLIDAQHRDLQKNVLALWSQHEKSYGVK